jgi:proteasome lid subunit RPN8/RPN11
LRVKRIELGSLKRILEVLTKDVRVEKVSLLIGKVEGETARAMIAYRVTNIKGSAVEFEADPWQVVQAHEVASKHGLEVIAILHTHPTCPAIPSTLDLRGMRLWPIIWVIACRGEVRAWVLEDVCTYVYTGR